MVWSKLLLVEKLQIPSYRKIDGNIINKKQEEKLNVKVSHWANCNSMITAWTHHCIRCGICILCHQATQTLCSVDLVASQSVIFYIYGQSTLTYRDPKMSSVSNEYEKKTIRSHKEVFYDWVWPNINLLFGTIWFKSSLGPGLSCFRPSMVFLAISHLLWH